MIRFKNIFSYTSEQCKSSANPLKYNLWDSGKVEETRVPGINIRGHKIMLLKYFFSMWLIYHNIIFA